MGHEAPGRGWRVWTEKSRRDWRAGPRAGSERTGRLDHRPVRFVQFITYTAGNGETNVLTLASRAAKAGNYVYEFREESSAVNYGPVGAGSCTRETPRFVRCTVPGRRRVVTQLSDRDDTLLSSTAVNAFGGSGNDTLNSTGEDSVLAGESGDDVFPSWREGFMVPQRGPDRFVGGPGRDRLEYWCTGNVLASPCGGVALSPTFASLNGQRAVRTTADNLPNDGWFILADGFVEGDSIDSDVEDIVGTNAGDLLSNGDASGRIDGNLGPDTLYRDEGADELIGQNVNYDDQQGRRLLVTLDNVANDGLMNSSGRSPRVTTSVAAPSGCALTADATRSPAHRGTSSCSAPAPVTRSSGVPVPTSCTERRETTSCTLVMERQTSSTAGRGGLIAR